MIMKNVKIGSTAVSEVDVNFGLTAKAMRDWLPEVFATPWLISMMEAAAENVLIDAYEEGETTVGYEVNCKHLAATPVGFKVTARAILTEIKGNMYKFDVEVFDDNELIGKGTHTRALVNKELFLNNVEKKKLTHNKE